MKTNTTDLMRKALASVWSQSIDQVTDSEANWAIGLVSPRSKGFQITLTTAQVAHLLTLLHERAEEGSYYGNKEQYYARTRGLIDLLGSAVSTK